MSWLPISVSVSDDGVGTIRAPHGADIAELQAIAGQLKAFAAVDHTCIEFYDPIACDMSSEFEMVH